jgi:protocatechuate 3,4-dioxygenase beta subunit
VQLTGEDGTAAFRTIYPGWYRGRATHIHLKAHLGGKAGRYTGGHVAHTGQMFFSDALTDRVAKLAPTAAARSRVSATRPTTSTPSRVAPGRS